MFKKYKFKGKWRIRAGRKDYPDMDLSLSCACAGCISVFLNAAYNLGYTSAKKNMQVWFNRRMPGRQPGDRGA